MHDPPPRVLLIEPDASARRDWSEHLRAAGFSVEESPGWCPPGGDETDRFAEEGFAVTVVDVASPASRGLAFIEFLRQRAQENALNVIALTSDADPVFGERAVVLGAENCLRKPVRAEDLVARVRAQSELRDLRDELARKDRDARVVLELMQALASSHDVREILQTVVRQVAATLNVGRVSVVLAQEHGDRGWVLAASDDAELQELPITLERYPEIQQVLATGRPLTIDDATTHPMLVQVREFIRHTRLSKLTLVPLTAERDVVGVLFVRADDSRGPLDSREIDLCRIAANATVIALRNAREIERLRTERDAETLARSAAERRARLLQRYADVFMSSADGMMVLDPSGTLLIVNPQASEIMGRAESELHGGRIERVVHPDDLFVLREMREKVEAGQPVTNVDVRIVRSDTLVRTLSVSTAPVREEHAVLVTFRDVTEERTTAHELARTQAFLSSLIEGSPDAIVAADLDGTILLFNTAAERILGYDRADVVGQMSVRALYRDGHAREIMQRIRGAPEGRLEALRTEVIARNGEAIPVMLSAATLKDKSEVVASVGIFSDLRERMKIEERLAQVQSQLARTEKQMLIAELSGAAAHELNQPLTAIHGYAEFLQRRLEGDTENTRYIDVILREAERMAVIVRKIGMISRYETKPYVGDAQIIDINASAAADDTPRSGPPEK